MGRRSSCAFSTRTHRCWRSRTTWTATSPPRRSRRPTAGTVLDRDVYEDLAALKHQSGRTSSSREARPWFGGLLGRGLLDELNITVLPVVVGAGYRLFPQASTAEDLPRLRLTLASCQPLRGGALEPRGSSRAAARTREARGRCAPAARTGTAPPPGSARRRRQPRCRRGASGWDPVGPPAEPRRATAAEAAVTPPAPRWSRSAARC